MQSITKHFLKIVNKYGNVMLHSQEAAEENETMN
jgi:hypothetical protein